MDLWRYHRESFLAKLSGITEEDASSSLVGSGTSLLWLADHMATTQLGWLAGRFLGEPPRPDPLVSATVAEAVAFCRESWATVDQIIDAHDFDELCAQPVHGDTDPVNLRWVVVHLLEETARHAGHADILRELIDGSIGR
jgi:hypothetical protein